MTGKKTFLDKTNPLDKLSRTKQNTEPFKEIPVVTEFEPNEEKIPLKRKAGRPKTKDIKNTCKNINVAVPITLLEKWEDIKIVHGSNLTEYITKLIERDMNANYIHYKEISDRLKNL